MPHLADRIYCHADLERLPAVIGEKMIATTTDDAWSRYLSLSYRPDGPTRAGKGTSACLGQWLTTCAAKAS